MGWRVVAWLGVGGVLLVCALGVYSSSSWWRWWATRGGGLRLGVLAWLGACGVIARPGGEFVPTRG